MAGMCCRFSMPTPCSPVMEPPNSMHIAMISPARDFGALWFAGDAAIVEDERVQVAVAGVEDIGHAQFVFVAQAFDGGERLAQPAARHHAILHDMVGPSRPTAENALAPLPDAGAVGIVDGDALRPDRNSR